MAAAGRMAKDTCEPSAKVNELVMRKRLITPIPQDVPSLDEGWPDLDDAAVVEVTSEEKEYPVESALVSGEMRGWRAVDSGTQPLKPSD